MPNKAAPCRFYALGHCQKGSTCSFSHSNEKQVCQFYLAGNCSYGTKCVNKHDKSAKNNTFGARQNTTTALKAKPIIPVSLPSKKSSSSSSASPWRTSTASNNNASNSTNNIDNVTTETLLCPFRKEDCKWGTNCKSIHGDICPICDLPVLDPTRPSSHQSHINSCSAKSQDATASEDLECVVCYESVKKDGKGVFGLLDCAHVACYGCISQWRGVEKQVGSKTCPICTLTLIIGRVLGGLTLDYNVFYSSVRGMAKD